MKRSLLPLIVLAAAIGPGSAFAQSALIGGATMPRPVPHADPLGPRSTDSTVAEALARSQVRQSGYSVHDLMRTGDGGWQGVALDRNSKPVVIAVDSHGKVSEVR
jgi:hypothetical protein